MSRIRLNQELRNKTTSRFKVHFEQEQTQEKEKFFQERENFKAIQDKTWELAKVCVKTISKRRCFNGTLSSRQISKRKYS